jgi:ABC-2 type transport system ATP-binding protein
MKKIMLEIKDLSKSFDNLAAVDHISFTVNKSEIFGFLGPNGAGKTTTINLICSLLKPDSGSIILKGTKMSSANPSIRKHLGVVPQDIALYQDLNAIENLKFWGGLYGLKGVDLKNRVNDLLSLMDLSDRSKDKVKNFSGGMKRRLNLACGIIHRPKLLLLDEPTVGIDPQGRHKLLDMIRDFANQGITIFYTTHYLDEAEALCDRLAIIDFGKILAIGTQEEIKQIVGENRYLKVTGTFDKTDAKNLVKEINELELISLQDQEIVYSLPVKYGTGEFLEKLVAKGFHIENLSIKEPSLDSAFIKLTGRELRD